MCVLSEECRAGSAPPGENDVMANSFLFSKPVEWTESQLYGGSLALVDKVLLKTTPGLNHINSVIKSILKAAFLQANALLVCLLGGNPLIVLVVMFGCTSWGERSCVALARLTCSSE